VAATRSQLAGWEADFSAFVSWSPRRDPYTWLGVFATEPAMVSAAVCRT
jgi:hypothetical protein